MKLWHKIFLGSFILFELIFNVITLYLVQYNFNQNLIKEVDRGLTEHYLLYSTLKSNSELYQDKFQYNQSFILGILGSTFKDYARYLDPKGIYLEVLDENNQLIYKNFPLEYTGEREELQVSLNENRTYIIRDVGTQSFLYVTNLLPLTRASYKLTYIRDISGVYQARSEQYQLLLKINLVTAFILALGLFLLTKYWTMPISQLTESARKIAGGDYRERVKIIASDEVGVLGEAFNYMSSAVESKVKELKNNSAMKQRFIENLTHEIKTPLTSIIGYADFLRTTKYQEKIFFEALNHIYREGKRLERLSFKLMDLILLDKRELALRRESIPEICWEVKEILQTILKTKNIALVLDVQHCEAKVEKDLILVLLSNLIGNAIKASVENSSIYLRAFCDGEKLLLQVEDSGVGIPEKDLTNVFEPFFMADKSRSESHEGFGLGLAICSEIVQLHQGEIKLSSVSGQGTTVKINIPQDIADL